MVSKKGFDIDKHLSRLISIVKTTPQSSLSEKKPSTVDSILPDMTKDDLTEIIKNAMKLDTLGQYEEALSWYDQALKLDSQNIDTMFKKALLLSKTNKYEQALFLFDQIIEVDPTLVSALVNRKIVLEKLGKHFGIIQLSDKQFS